jgi:hypothetical protein
VRDVKVSFEKEKAWLSADDSVADEALVEAVVKAGYKGKVTERKKQANNRIQKGGEYNGKKD